MEFKNAGTEDLFNGLDSKAARSLVPSVLAKLARRKLIMLAAAVTLESLRIPPSNHLEALKSDRAGQHSIRINDRYRVCFVWTGSEPIEVEVVDYH